MSEDKKRFDCVGECKRDFNVGEWECFPGQKHLVAEKTYYLADAPHHDPKLDPEGLVFRSARTQFYAIPEKRTLGTDGKIEKSQPAPVVFIQGRYATTDPEEQYFIERAKIDVGYDRWFEAYHTPIQKQRIKDQQQHDREIELKQKLAEANTLLEGLKAKAAKDSAAETEGAEQPAAASEPAPTSPPPMVKNSKGRAREAETVGAR